MLPCSNTRFSIIFFFNDTATTEIYTLSLHDALPIYLISKHVDGIAISVNEPKSVEGVMKRAEQRDRKSTRLNSSHQIISYAVFCLKKKNHRALDVASETEP